MTKRKEYTPTYALLQELKKYEGFPNKTREQRKEVRKYNPLHYSFGNVRPVWKTWETYAQNMELIHGGLYEND